MAFDQPTRNRLARFVGEARALLTEEFTRQLQLEYAIDPASGAVAGDEQLGHLDDAGRQTAQLLRATLEHYLAGVLRPDAKARQAAIERIVREQAFTVLNRLCALRMAEARELLIDSVTRGYQSKGFQLYARLAGTALGETGDAYRTYLFSLFDEFAVDLAVLFDRFSPQGRLFPREAALLALLDQINHPEIAELWAEDETIGWIYQYFNSKEERKAMREASQAPRNSRDLAVRNQFFTPRYVVEFLTDNTLGRIWYEMTQGQTDLVDSCRYMVRRPNEIFLAPGEKGPPQAESAQSLSQEELLRQPVHIHRPLKDPRAITMLDPACGSMHFGLYAFDLFERIYDEAWDLEGARGARAFERAPLDAPLRKEYTDKVAFLRDVPRLIVERNIHGVDIDPRAVQIAGLSLWLRAQRSWHNQGLKPQERPEINRSNIVCAEPMPGDKGLLSEFIAKQLAATPEDRAIGEMLPAIFTAMELAGEAGSLLKIEEQITGVIDAGRAKFEQTLLQSRKDANYLPGLAPERDTTLFDLLELPNPEEFWQQAEGRIYAALRDYAVQAENGAAYRRRLFADDAERGFAFIDLCRKRYDVVLMNPPFGMAAKNSATYIAQVYGQLAVDTYTAFVTRGLELSNAFLGAITSRTGFFLPTSFNWRKHIQNERHQIETCADLGFQILDAAAVETAAYCISVRPYTMPSMFIRLIEAGEKEAVLNELSSQQFSQLQRIFLVLPNDLNLIPLSPFSYWTTNQIRHIFQRFPPLCREKRTARLGLVTFDDSRFLRLSWEVPTQYIGRGKMWVRFAKGGEYQKWYSDIHLVVNWENEASEMKALFTMYKEAGRLVPGLGPLRKFPYYFFPGITWPRSTAKGFNARALPEGVIFGDKGPGLVNDDGSQHELKAVLALMNTMLFEKLILLQTASRAWEVGFIQRIPIPELSSHVVITLTNIADVACNKVMSVSRHYESELIFTNPFRYHKVPESLLSIEAENELLMRNTAMDLKDLEDEADEWMKNLLLFSKEDIDALTPPLRDESIKETSDENAEFPIQVVLQQVTPRVVSYTLGSIFGRWDIRSATGECAAPDLPDPFAPLPACSPGMLQNAEGMPAAPGDVPASYPLRISWPGILVDDEGHPEDIEGRVREAIQVIWGERAEAIEQEAGEILGVRSLREYFRKPALFFSDHLSRYSKSRRQAPIYWPLSTSSGSYTLWLYYHCLTDQTLYSCVNDFVEPKLKQVTDEASRLRQKTGRSRSDEQDLEQLTDLERELGEFRAELLRVAAFWKPNLNDGVQITAAPLWKLFAHKPWQKKLKEIWANLEAGEYDWAHLSYSIWPERVRAKCRADKSLAIAHDLEALYVTPPASASKKGRAKKAAEENTEMFGEE